MPQFYFHVSNGHGETPDEEGTDLEDQSAARRLAIESIRSMVSEDARTGTIDLDGHIEIRDGASNVLLMVGYAEAFDLHIPGGKLQP
jgi:hypothetical protein